MHRCLTLLVVALFLSVAQPVFGVGKGNGRPFRPLNAMCDFCDAELRPTLRGLFRLQNVSTRRPRTSCRFPAGSGLHLPRAC